MADFDYFVVFAEMRTGSNFLEANLNAFDGITCHGEAFNPHFIGYPNSEDILGVTKSAREADPMVLLAAIRDETDGIGGFRFFNDHDARVLPAVLDDPRCAKIILTRNPIDSYISWKIAQATGQWKLTNAKHAKSEKVAFDAAEFGAHLDALQGFQVQLLNTLQRSGQTAFYVAYEDLQDVAVMNGLADWLGCDTRLEGLDKKLKKQNPAPMAQKVSNYEEMAAALARLDRFNLDRTPNFEPRRGPAVPTYMASAQAPLLYLPIRSGPEAAIRSWLAALDGGSEDALTTGFTQKTLRHWKRSRPGHRTFTVIRHPVARAHAAFCDRILNSGKGSYLQIRQTLVKHFGLDLPETGDDPAYDSAAHRSAFLGFLRFLRMNLGGQTSIRVDACWASQAAVLEGSAAFAPLDMVIREHRMQDDLAYLAGTIGLDAPEVGSDDPHRGALETIYDAEIEKSVRDAYQRDYMAFGFSAWGE